MTSKLANGAVTLAMCIFFSSWSACYEMFDGAVTKARKGSDDTAANAVDTSAQPQAVQPAITAKLAPPSESLSKMASASEPKLPASQPSIPLPPKPTDEREIERHCVGVTVRELQIARLILKESEVSPQLRQIYEQRKGDAESFAALLGMMGLKEHEIDERETSAVAVQFGMKKANDDNLYYTDPAQEKPNQNEEMLWTRLRWCEAHMTR